MIIDGRTGKPLRIPGVNDSLSKRCFAMESSGRLFDELPGAGGANIAFNAFNANLVKVIRGVLDKRIRAARRAQLDAEVQRLVEESPQHKKLLADEARRKELLIAFNKAHNFLLNTYAEVHGLQIPKLEPECSVCYERGDIDAYLNFTTGDKKP